MNVTARMHQWRAYDLVNGGTKLDTWTWPYKVLDDCKQLQAIGLAVVTISSACKRLIHSNN